MMRTWCWSLVAMLVATGCALDSGNGGSEDDRSEATVTQAIKMPPAAPIDPNDPTGGWQPPPYPTYAGSRLGLYFVDGSTMKFEDNTVIAYMFDSVRAEVPVRRYFEGPDTLCRINGSCREVRDDVAASICADLQANRIDVYAVFGYSRGAILANVSAHDAFDRCRHRFNGSLESRYIHGGFIDAVAHGIANWHDGLPFWTSFLHIHRQWHWSPHWFRVQKFSAFRGENLAYAKGGVSHSDMGYEVPVAQQIMDNANYRVGQKLGIAAFY